MPLPDSAWFKDAAERVGWTAAEAGVAAVITYLGDIPDKGVWIPILATGLASLKTFIAKHVGNKETAAIGGNK